MNLDYLWFARDEHPKQFEEYMNKRYKNNWGIFRGNSREEIKLILIRDVLNKPLSNDPLKDNFWKLTGGKYNKKITLIKQKLEKSPVKIEEIDKLKKIGRGFYLEK